MRKIWFQRVKMAGDGPCDSWPLPRLLCVYCFEFFGGAGDIVINLTRS